MLLIQLTEFFNISLQCFLKSDFCSCSLDPVPKPGMPLPPHAMAHPRMPADHKHLPVVARGSAVYPQPQLTEMCYDPRLPPSASQYEPPQYSTGELQSV